MHWRWPICNNVVQTLRLNGRSCQLAKGLVHHCCSQGTPSWLPSISIPGQFFRKAFASVHEVICEQCLRPSHCPGAQRVKAVA